MFASASVIGAGLSDDAADEAEHLRHFLDQVPGVLVHVHLHQHVAREKLPLAAAFLPFAHLDDLFGRHENLAKAILKTVELDALLEEFFDLVLEI